MEPIDHHIHLVRETAAQVLDVSCAFWASRMAVAVSMASASVCETGFEQQAGHLGNGLHQTAIVGVAQFFDQRDKAWRMGPRTEAEPALLPAQNLFQVSSVAAIASRKRRRTDSTATGVSH
jgi:hypothetical protein